MDLILEIVKFTVPSLFVLIVSLYWIHKYFSNEKDKRHQRKIDKAKETVVPVRIQAYERIALYLERISPDTLITRIYKPEQTVAQLQHALIFAIRSELEHNFAQQIYISHKAWEMVRSVKERMINIINNAAEKLDKKEPGVRLSTEILESLISKKENPVNDALNFLKSEIQEIYN